MITQNGGQSAFKRFLKDNRTLVISIPILAILLIVVIIIYSGMGSSKSQGAVPVVAETTNAPAQTIEILPNTERVINSNESGDKQKSTQSTGNAAIKDPFSGPITLVGVLVDANGGGMAVIEANNKSYIVRKDDILENGMTVSSISTDQITLKDNDREMLLKLEKRSNSQTAN
jgi:Tfp pilus assembly protein PilP